MLLTRPINSAEQVNCGHYRNRIWYDFNWIRWKLVARLLRMVVSPDCPDRRWDGWGASERWDETDEGDQSSRSLDGRSFWSDEESKVVDCHSSIFGSYFTWQLRRKILSLSCPRGMLILDKEGSNGRSFDWTTVVTLSKIYVRVIIRWWESLGGLALTEVNH